ncbi:MAG: glycosyltransferase family 4 protein [Thermoleophilia bacterium]
MNGENGKKSMRESVVAASGKIWIVVFTGNSGLTHYSYCLARALHAAGCEVTLVTNKNYELDFLPADFPVIKVFGRSRFYMFHIFRFWRLYRRESPELVHYQAPLKFPVIELLLLKLQKSRGTRLVFTAHDWLPHGARAYHTPLFRWYYRLFDRIIVHSRSGAHFMETRLGVKPGKLAVVPHGDYGFFNTDAALSDEAARERLQLDSTRYWFLFFGHIAPYKGLDLAIEALGRAMVSVGQGDRSLGLLVAGDPEAPGMEKYEQLIKELGLGHSVSLHVGHIPVADVQIYLKASDALVLPYRESSTSGIVHLAMGFGKPVIASDVGGLAETVSEASAGLIVPPGDVEALAQAMKSLAVDEEIRRRIQSGREKAEPLFSWDKIAIETMAVYSATDVSATRQISKNG